MFYTTVKLVHKKFGLTLLSSQFLSPDMPKKMTLIVFMHSFPSPNLPFPLRKFNIWATISFETVSEYNLVLNYPEFP